MDFLDEGEGEKVANSKGIEFSDGLQESALDSEFVFSVEFGECGSGEPGDPITIDSVQNVCNSPMDISNEKSFDLKDAFNQEMKEFHSSVIVKDTKCESKIQNGPLDENPEHARNYLETADLGDEDYTSGFNGLERFSVPWDVVWNYIVSQIAEMSVPLVVVRFQVTEVVDAFV
jgi:hypothetical protein